MLRNFAGSPIILARLGHIVAPQFIPGKSLSELNPTILDKELDAEREEEFLKTALATMLASISAESPEEPIGKIEANHPND